MAVYLVKGILIGLLFGLPVGAVGAMTVQRTWSFGVRAGLLTGLGSSVADCIYAIVGAFGLTLVSDFLLRYQTIIHALGGGLILFMGLRLMLKQKEREDRGIETKAMGGGKLFLSSFAVGITNPAAILTFLFAFSYFGISGTAGPLEGAGLVCGVFLGTYLWWGTLSAAAWTVKQKSGSRGVRYGNQVFGGILTLFGAVILFRMFL